MAKLGDRVNFQAAFLHHTETVKDGRIIKGSIYCVDQTEFAGFVGRVYDAPVEANGGAEGEHKPQKSEVLHDLFIFVPGKTGQWVVGIRQGSSAGEFKVL